MPLKLPPNKYDPTKTRELRRRFEASVQRRLRAIIRAITEAVVVEDVFGLAPAPVLNSRYAFLSDADKIPAFRTWLDSQTQAQLLEQVGGVQGVPWTAPYIDSAYKRGAMNAYTAARPSLQSQSPVYGGTREEFLRQVFSAPESISKIQLIYTRSFEGMRGVTEQIGSQLNTVLADGLVHGSGPREIARKMAASVATIGKRRALVIARTEIIRAHAEGQLDMFGQLGVDSVSAEVEFLTTGDDRVCPQCASLSGVVFTLTEARGIIPVHPNCRCAWAPSIKVPK